MSDTRNTIILQMAETYFDFLMSLPYDNTLYMAGIREGKGKFLSNLHIHLLKQMLPKGANSKWYATDWVSPAALEQMQKGNMRELVYEHMVPKSRYIQQVLEEKARNKTLTREFVLDHLARFWWVATITKSEDSRLSRTFMPKDWNEVDPFGRYAEAGIQLLPHRMNSIKIEA